MMSERDGITRILLIEDSPGDARLFREHLREAAGNRFELVHVDRLEPALALLQQPLPDVIFLDLSLPDSSGLTTFSRLYAQVPQLPVVILTGLDDEAVATQAVREGAQDYLIKDQASGSLLARCMRYAIARKLAEDTLARERSLLRAVIDHLPEAIYAEDREGRITVANSQLVRIVEAHSSDDLVGRFGLDLLPPAFAARLRAHERKVLIEGRPLVEHGEMVIDSKHMQRSMLTTVVPLRDDQGRVDGLVGILQDVTERQHIEERLREAQKMEAVGRLAGGVAHDFSNLLTVIKGHCTFALHEAAAGDPLRENLVEIEKAADSAASLTRQLLAFSRRQVMEMRVFSLNDVLQSISKMLARLIREDIALRLQLDPSSGNIRADPEQIEQVVVNLVLNARDAMPQGGMLTIETANIELDDEFTSRHPGSCAGPHVVLSVSDTGVGMTRQVMEHIFEPFYTTKGHQGTGLGLSTVYGIVKQSGGELYVASVPGRGSTFHVCLPCAQEAPASRDTAPEPPALPQGSETVLLVEDDLTVRRTIRYMLRSLGYNVLEAPHAAGALDLVRTHAEPIHLVMTDVVMPDMNGPELVRRLSEQGHHFRVLYASGYMDDTIAQELSPQNVSLLAKPISIEALASRVRQTLDAP